MTFDELCERAKAEQEAVRGERRCRGCRLACSLGSRCGDRSNPRACSETTGPCRMVEIGLTRISPATCGDSEPPEQPAGGPRLDLGQGPPPDENNETADRRRR
jgi:hypothetical protein